MLAAQGYAVVYVNPRGSHGYGQDFVNRVRGDYGGGDYRDVMQAVDEAVQAYPFIDSGRLGVTGGSYGGFMTNWIVGQTGRFSDRHRAPFQIGSVSTVSAISVSFLLTGGSDMICLRKRISFGIVLL